MARWLRVYNVCRQGQERAHEEREDDEHQRRLGLGLWRMVDEGEVPTGKREFLGSG